MFVNKKIDRLKQWAGERMGGEIRTNVSDDFKVLEYEMGLRHEGMKENHKAMGTFVKELSRRCDGDDKDKQLPVGALGAAMANYGDQFESDSQFGQCLLGLGRTNERISCVQETYMNKATATWLESLERSLAQMKEYQAARKKMESRRLAYDTAIVKIQKAKKEDFRAEEELRSQKVKYEESSEDVHRRMLDIKESEGDSVADLKDFLDAELEYHERCREALIQLKKSWPEREGVVSRRSTRTRSNTTRSYSDEEFASGETSDASPPMPCSSRPGRYAPDSLPPMPKRDTPSELGMNRPAVGRSATFGFSTHNRDVSPVSQPMARVTSDSLSIRTQKAQLRAAPRLQTDGFDEPSDSATYYSNSSPERCFSERADSPATSYGSIPSRNVSSAALSAMAVKKPPPPPPPSRAKKPPPPPPPPSRRVECK